MKHAKANHMKKKKKNKVIAHLEGDIKDFNKEANEDRKLIKELKKSKKKKKK